MENIVVKEIIPNKDKTIIDIKLENGEVIKAFKTDNYFLYTLGGNFDSETVYKLYNKLTEYKQLFFVGCLENCFKEHRIGGVMSFSSDMEAKEYFKKKDETRETYSYPELDEIIKNEKEKEENKRLQKQYEQTKGSIDSLNNILSQGAEQSIPSKK